jgi:hypothetical protein
VERERVTECRLLEMEESNASASALEKAVQWYLSSRKIWRKKCFRVSRNTLYDLLAACICKGGRRHGFFYAQGEKEISALCSATTL